MHKRAVKGRYLLLLLYTLLIFSSALPGQIPTTLRVGIYMNPPLVTTDLRGRPGGLFIDILEQIARQEGWKLRYIVGTWSDQLQRLSTGSIDLLPAIAFNEARQQRFLFSDHTVIANWGQIFVSEDSDIQSIPDLDGKRIAVLRDDVYITADPGLMNICEAFDIDCKLTEYATYDMVLRAVVQGKADAGLVNRLFGATRGHTYTPIASPIVLMPLDIRIAISRMNPHAEEIKQQIDHQLTIMKADDFSIYHQRLGSLFERNEKIVQTPAWIYQAASVGGLLVAALLIAAQILRWQIKKKSRELATTEARYHRFFDGVATALCEGDSSRALDKLEQLIDSGVQDVRAYFDTNPDELKAYLALIRVVNANPATLKLFGVNTLTELQRWVPKSVTPEVCTAFKEFLVAVNDQQATFACEVPLLTADGRTILAIVSFPLSETMDAASHIPVSMLDVTHLRETERQLSLVIKGASLGFWDWNLATDELIVNDRWMEMLGLEPTDLMNHIDDWRGRLHPGDEERILPIVTKHIEDGTPYKVEFRMLHSDGHWIWIEGSGGAVEHDPLTQHPIRACGTHQEISERKRAAETLHTLMQSMVGITGEDFFEHVARELCRWFDADAANIGELVDNNRVRALATIVDNKIVEDFKYNLKGTPSNNVINQGARLYPQGIQDLFPGDEGLVVLNVQGYAGSPIRDLSGDVIGIVWVVSRKPLFMAPDWADVMDIIAARISAEIERMRAMDKLEHQATFDVLTELPNRRLLIDRLTQAQARCRRHHHNGAVLFMDLDHFKTINDSLGHNVGDLLLQQVAHRLLRQIRNEDTACRLGGDEFVVLFSELSGNHQLAAQQAQQGASKIQKALSQPYTINDNELHITPSIGIVIFPMDGENADDILKYADTAMYRAKDEGRNTIRFFLPGMQQAAEEQLRLQNDLRYALKNDQLLLYFQPQMDVDENLIGAEALLRWAHPQNGIVEPGIIIPVAEESGQILQISEWVLKQALTQGKQWMDGAVNLKRIAINISSVHFHQVGFADQIEQILQETSVNPSQLTLEIQEDTLVENFEEAAEKVLKLKKLGVRFSIDGFGIGYASIAYLRRLPLDELKIDRSFVRDITGDPKDAQLVQTIITMARLMEIEVVAIGVETEAQLQFLRDNGCKIFQGYYFSHPLPADQFEANLKKELV
ncbi:MAG: EAL domain-containing protein [Candidatus Thiodiazotropha sp. (ex Dulcina madagascariensis)]|nr:EAL domain-containing protein [Candidatus Thiodiazotropha sp. (ex Dulcina madagascariensis)]